MYGRHAVVETLLKHTPKPDVNAGTDRSARTGLHAAATVSCYCIYYLYYQIIIYFLFLLVLLLLLFTFLLL